MSAANNRFVQGINLALESCVLLVHNFKIFFYCLVPLSIISVGISKFAYLSFIAAQGDISAEEVVEKIVIAHYIQALFMVCLVLFINQLAKAQKLTTPSWCFKFLHAGVAVFLLFIIVLPVQHLITLLIPYISGTLNSLFNNNFSFSRALIRRSLQYVFSLMMGGGFLIIFPAIVVGACPITRALRLSFATFYNANSKISVT